MRQMKEDRPAGNMPEHLVRDAPSVLVTAYNMFLEVSDGQRWVRSNASLSVCCASQCKPWKAVSGMNYIRRSSEPLEAVGLILHQPQCVEACSKEELAEALGSLLCVLEDTREKVTSHNGLSHAYWSEMARTQRIRDLPINCAFGRPARGIFVRSMWRSTPCGPCLIRSCPSQCFSPSCQSSAACCTSTWRYLSPTEAAGMLMPPL